MKKPAVAASKRTELSPEQAAAALARALAPDPTAEDAALREMVLGALREVGGQAYLVACAKNVRTRGMFLTLLGRLATARQQTADGWTGTVNVFTGIERRNG